MLLKACSSHATIPLSRKRTMGRIQVEKNKMKSSTTHPFRQQTGSAINFAEGLSSIATLKGTPRAYQFVSIFGSSFVPYTAARHSILIKNMQNVSQMLYNIRYKEQSVPPSSPSLLLVLIQCHFKALSRNPMKTTNLKISSLR